MLLRERAPWLLGRQANRRVAITVPLGKLSLRRKVGSGTARGVSGGGSGGGTRGKRCAHHAHSLGYYSRRNQSLPKELKTALPRPTPSTPRERSGNNRITPLSLHYSPTKLPITSLLMTPYLMLYRLYLLSRNQAISTFWILYQENVTLAR